MVKKRWLVVSTNAINEIGLYPILVRVTKKARERAAPTAVEVEPDEANNLPEVSYVLCHDLLTLPFDQLDEQFGHLGPLDLSRVETALKYALSL
jgi:mRNA-degrading endonuclease toxin of MazEF toxin-antitoxin module